MGETFYKMFKLGAVEDSMLLANWLTLNGNDRDPEKRAVSVALHLPKRGKGGELAFATRDEVVLINLKDPLAEVWLQVCRSVLIDQPQIGLLARDVYQDLVDLSHLFSERCDLELRLAYDRLAPAFVGDLWSACLITGFQPVGKPTFKQTADDAYDVAISEPQYSHAITAYYPKVSLPAARMWAEAKLFKRGEKPDWLVSYKDLWLRVLAHYTSDPTLIFAFSEQRDAIDSVARILKVTGAQAQALLLWQAHNREVAAMHRFSQVVDDLPDSLPHWCDEMDKHFPALCNSISHMAQAYQESRAAHTLYGRKMRPGHSFGEATAFRIFGTVEDIISVAAVSFWQSRTSPDILVSGISGGAAAREVQIQGEGPAAGKEMWRKVLDQLSNFKHMQVELSSRIVLL